jgi:hypothetical protein
MKRNTFEPKLAASFNLGWNKFLIRGSSEWDAREWEREKRGCCLLSYGTIEDSKRSLGRSSGKRMN